jgi:hypothetical protein
VRMLLPHLIGNIYCDGFHMVIYFNQVCKSRFNHLSFTVSYDSLFIHIFTFCGNSCCVRSHITTTPKFGLQLIHDVESGAE